MLEFIETCPFDKRCEILAASSMNELNTNIEKAKRNRSNSDVDENKVKRQMLAVIASESLTEIAVQIRTVANLMINNADYDSIYDMSIFLNKYIGKYNADIYFCRKCH